MLYHALENLEVFDWLLNEKKLDINAGTTFTGSLLHCVSTENNMQMVKLLVEKKADLNVQDESGTTPLHENCFKFWRHKNLEMIKLLIDAKADIKIANNNNQTPFMAACKLHNFKLLNYLFQNESKLTKRELEPFVKNEDFPEIIKDFCVDIEKNFCSNFKKKAFDFSDIKQDFAEILKDEFLKKFDINENQEKILSWLICEHYPNSTSIEEFHKVDLFIKEIGQLLAGDISALYT